MKKYYSVMILFAMMVAALSNVHLGAKMNIEKSVEMPIYKGLSVDFVFDGLK